MFIELLWLFKLFNRLKLKNNSNSNYHRWPTHVLPIVSGTKDGTTDSNISASKLDLVIKERKEKCQQLCRTTSLYNGSCFKYAPHVQSHPTCPYSALMTLGLFLIHHKSVCDSQPSTNNSSNKRIQL